MIRSNVMDTLGEDYVRTARAKGAPRASWCVGTSSAMPCCPS